MRKIFAAILPAFFIAVGAGALYAAETCVVESVDLKDSEGNWRRVSQPDTVIPFEEKEAAVSFFNNGRVPPGEYVNFRVGLLCTAAEASASLEKHHARVFRVTGKSDWSALEIRKGSFVRIEFLFDNSEEGPIKKVKRIQILADEETRRVENADLVLAP